MESKHGVLRGIYARLKHAAPGESLSRKVAKTFRILNDLYENGVMSAYESAKGFTRPIIPSSTAKNVPEDIRIAQEELIAKPKLNLMLRSKTIRDPKLSIGYMVQVTSKWKSQAGILLRAETSTALRSKIGIVALAGKQRRKLQPAVGDVRYALQPLFTVRAQYAIDQIDSEVDEALSLFEADPLEEPSSRCF